jgi:tetratricopeptide (TPR) repeat protein
LLRGLELRVYATLGEVDSVAAVVRRWAVAAPRDETPYREWAIVLQDRRLFDEARRALLQGRAALERPSALAVELAELEQRVGNWEAGAREWALAVTATPSHHANAVGQLEAVPEDSRARVLERLTSDGAAAPALRVAGELLVAWGEPARGWALFAGTVQNPGPDAATALRRFADRAAGAGTPGARLAQGLALERLADMTPPPLAARARADAARALVAAGDRAGARRVLERLAADSGAPPEVQALAQTAFVQALIDDGQLDAAADRLAALGPRITADDRQELRLGVARGRIARGQLDDAAAALEGDSSVAALALRGWVALYRGDLKSAQGLFRAAGPYAGERRDATERTAMLALMQQVGAERAPELGAALLRLARGDSSGAIGALKKAAEHLSGGQADVLLLAGQVAAALPGRTSDAAELFQAALRAGTAAGPGPAGAAAPAAELGWARLLLRQGKTQEAIARLEHLILTYPGSAVVPEARRELERTRGAIPRS